MPSREQTKPWGRPPKFSEPRRPVTMTLPERILDKLALIDPDRALAVVKVTEAVGGVAEDEHFKPVQLVEMAPGKSLIVVGPTRSLSQIPWLKLIEIARARYLLTVPSGTPIEALEVYLRDLFHEPEVQQDEREAAVLRELLDIISQQRRTRRLSKAEILIVGSD